MTPSPPPPAASLAEHALILPWLPCDGRYVLVNHKRMRPSAARTDGFEIECDLGVLEAEANGGSRVSVWAPMEQLSLLRPGTIFEGRVLAGRVKALTERQATNLRATAMCELSDEGVGAHPYVALRHRPLDGAASFGASADPVATVGEHAGRRIYIRSGELLRFYFGPISWLAEAFLSAVHSPAGTGLIDLEATGMVEPGVMQIAPVAGLTDRSSALHLAMLLGSPDLMAMWREAAQGYLSVSGRNGDAGMLPPLVLAPGRHSLSLLGHTVPVWLDHFGGEQQRAFVAAAILSDFRPAPFQRLIIKLPHGMDEVDADDPERDELTSARRYRTIIAPDAALEGRRRPGVSLGQLSPHPESIRRAFPRLGRVEVKYDIIRPVRRAGSRLTDWQLRSIDSLSALAPGHDPTVGGVVLRPGPSYRAVAAEPGQVPSEKLLERNVIEMGRFEPFDRRSLSYPMPVFVNAFARLSRHQSGGLVGQDPLRAGEGKVMLMQAHPTWGNAWRGRQLAIGQIEVAGRTAYAFEVSRRRKTERISLGLVARADGAPMSLRELSTVAEHAIAKLSVRTTKKDAHGRGVWPISGNFNDVRGRIVPHTARRRLVALLAEDLEALARTLFDPPAVQAAA